MNAAQGTVLIVEHNRRNQALMSELLVSHGYRALGADDLEAIDRLLSGGQPVRLALVDLAGFDQRVWQYCQAFQSRGVPVVLIAPPAYGSRIQLEGLARGALSVLFKPVSPQQLLHLINRLMSE